MPGHTLERLQTRTMPTGDLDSSFDDRSRDVATGEPQLGSPQIRAVSPMESIAELPVQAVLDSSDVGGVEACMSQPAANYRNVNSCRDKTRRRGVAKRMRRDSLIRQGRNPLGSRRHV